jgi:hypothetical protein
MTEGKNQLGENRKFRKNLGIFDFGRSQREQKSFPRFTPTSDENFFLAEGADHSISIIPRSSVPPHIL